MEFRMSASNRKDAIIGTLVPGLVDRSTGHPEFVLERSRIIRNGTVVWLYGKPTNSN